MARLRKRERWAANAQAMIDGVSLVKVAQRCGVHATTAFGAICPAQGKGAALALPLANTQAMHPGLFFENIPAREGSKIGVMLAGMARLGVVCQPARSKIKTACAPVAT